MKTLLTGATGGLGMALLEKLNQVIMVGRDENALQALKKKFPQNSYVVANLASPLGQKRVLEVIEKEKPELIINNAGFGVYGKSHLVSLEEQENIIEVNCKALFAITHKGVKTLIEAKKSGIILNISSIAGEMPTPLMSVYGASKAFVTQMSKAIDFESRKEGVRVLVSLPGQIDTPFATKAAKKKTSPSPLSIPKEKMASRLLWQIKHQKPVDIFDLRYRLVHHLLPDFITMRLIYKSLNKRIN